jgi:hypothetical protein
MRERNVLETLPDLAGCRFATRGQREVRAPGILTGERPLRLTMTDEIETQGIGFARRQNQVVSRGCISHEVRTTRIALECDAKG